MKPRLTVLMTVYNDARFLPPAMESILRQSYEDFQFLILDDGSTDSTPEVLRSFTDARLCTRRLDRNVGQTAALNIGLREAETPWIARMDADDVSHPQRLREQMDVLRDDPSLHCVGTGIWEFRENPDQVEIVKLRPQNHEEIWQAALCGSGMIHGSIVVHRDALLGIGGYNELYRYGSDREMFIRLLSRHRARNIQKPLLGVRRGPQQDSFTSRAAEEYLDLFRKLLKEDGFSEKDRSVLRNSLAYSYLFRSGLDWESKKFVESVRDMARAFMVSPGGCARTLAGSAFRRVLPPQWLKGPLSR